jgi:hypothetical protein
MSETLGQKQRRFAKMVARLIDKAHELGYEVSLGDAYRDPRVHGNMGVKQGYGHSRSAHKIRLAIDLNLFKDGDYLEQSSDHEPLGEWWEKQATDARWGGRFNDGNHYSLEHNGVK